MMSLQSPHLVSLVGVCLDPPLVIMELMGGGSLSNLLHRSPDIEISWSRKIDILCAISKGIQFLHQNNVAHRDLKPDNILLSHDHTEIKLADFGFSRKVNKKTGLLQSISVRGTPFYMSPELLLSSSTSAPSTTISGFPCDIYAFGIIMWEVAFRRPPDCGLEVNLLGLASKVINDNFRPPIDDKVGLTEDFVTLMRLCWDNVALKRPNIGDVLTTLLECREKPPTSMPPHGRERYDLFAGNSNTFSFVK